MPENCDAAEAVLAEIRNYRQDCPDYVVFVPLDEGHPLRRAVRALGDKYPPQGTLPLPGEQLWRQVLQSSLIPPQEEYLRVFSDLEAFEEWILRYYGFSLPDNTEAAPQTTPAGLSPSESKILAQVNEKPQKGEVIALRAGVSPDYARKLLSTLKKLRLIKNDGLGYYKP